MAALCLPCDAAGNLMQEALGAHLAWLRSKGIHGVLALGSTGEFPLMTLEQRLRALDAVAELAHPLPVIANISDINPSVVEALGSHARSLGLPGVAVMPPSFYPMTGREQLSFFERIAAKVELPVMLYNFPELTGNRISVETVATFAERASMFGIKQSGGEFDYHRELVKIGQEKGFSVFSGADTRLPEVFAIGAKGCIGGLVNFAPEYMLGIFDICRRGAVGDVETLAARMREIGALIDRLSFPVNVGMGLKARGLEAGCSRTHVSPEARRIFNEVASELAGLFKKWGLEPAVCEGVAGCG